MLKQLLHRFATGVMTLSLLMTAVATPLTNQYANAAETYPLVVHVNVPNGGAEITETYSGDSVKILNNCKKNTGSKYSCQTTLPEGSYTVNFTPVEGQNTPPITMIDLDGFDDVVSGTYTPQGDQNPGNNTPNNNPADTTPTKHVMTVNVNIANGGAVVTRTFNDETVATLKNCVANGVENYTCTTPALEEGSYTVRYTDVNDYTTPPLTMVQVDGTDDSVLGIYTQIEDNTTTRFQVRTQDDEGNALNEQYTRNALTTHTTPDAYTVKLADLNSYTLSFSNKDGYTKPGTVVISNKVINSLPSGVTVTENGATYSLGTVLKADAVYTFVGTYTQQDDGNIYFTINKQVLKETELADGNKEVDYRIVVKRSNSGPNKDVEVTVKDSISGKKKLYGSNGGVMEVVGNGTCNIGCGDITDGALDIELGKGEQAILEYTLRSDNTGIPQGENSKFVNTVVGNYDDEDGDDKKTDDDATVTVDGDDFDNTGLDIDLSADKDQAEKGECVLYTLTATNNTGDDLTGLVLTFDYDQTRLDITNTYGGTDNGSVVRWNHGDLDQGETVRKQARGCVTDNAKPGDDIRSIARGLVNEITNVPGDSHDLRVIDPNATAPSTPTPPKNADSGMGHTFLLLLASAAAYLTYQNTGRRRYAKLKAEALK